ncbi:MAG: hypothetical protein Q9175_001835 [Cornicularia normoerica]
MTVCPLILSLQVNSKLTTATVTCLIGFLLTVTYYASCVRDVNNGYVGYHSWDVTLGQVAASDFYMELVNPLGLGFIKLSFFILYSQIFKPVLKMRIALWIGATVCAIFYVLIFALNMYFATPRRGETYISHFLDPVVKGGIHLSVPFAAVGVVFDLVIIIIPIYGVCQLQLSGRQKFSISLVFLTGGFACVSAMLTLNYRIALQTTDDLLRILVPNLMTSWSHGNDDRGHLYMRALLIQNPKGAPALIRNAQIAPPIVIQIYQSIHFKSGDHISYKERLTGGKIASDRGYELHDGNFFQKFIGEGPRGFATEDGIHLKSEILQERAVGDELYQGDKRKSASVTAATEADMV